MARRFLSILCATFALGGCGGGSGSTPTPPAPGSVTVTQSVAATGGTVRASDAAVSGTVTFPAGQLASTASVTFTVFNAATFPAMLQSTTRHTLSIPTGGTLLGGMMVNTGGVAINGPLKLSFVTAAPAAGLVVRLAGSLSGSGFSDVDTATAAAGAVSNDDNPEYSGPSIASAAAIYAFYTIASANAAAPPATSPFSERPATVGTMVTYTGTLTQNITNIAIATPGPNPAVSPSAVVQAQSGTVTDVVTVATPNPAVSPASGTPIGLTSKETDTFPLETEMTTTSSVVAYQPFSSAAASGVNVRLVQSQATDVTSGAVFQTNYTPTSGLLAVLPEKPGSFGPNDGSQTFNETDPGVSVGANATANVTSTRTTNPDGSYTETQTNDDGSQNLATDVASPPTGTYSIESGFEMVTFGAPATTAQGPAIPITQVLNTQPQKTGSIAVPLWYPSLTPGQFTLTPALYTETDNVTPVTSYDQRCVVPAQFGMPTSMLTQNITAIDVDFGTVTQQTTTTYDIAGVGTVCSIVSENVTTYYDYTIQENALLDASGGSFPVLTSSATEVLSIASVGSATSTSTQSQKRTTASVTPGVARSTVASLGRAPILLARERFEHAFRLAHIRRALALEHALRQRTGGLR